MAENVATLSWVEFGFSDNGLSRCNNQPQSFAASAMHVIRC